MKRMTTLAAVCFLSACSGGGSDSATTTPSTPTTASAEGFWVGTTANGSVVNLAILDGGETWGLYGTISALVGAVYGNTSVSGNALSGTGLGFIFVTRVSGSGLYTGSVTTKGTISMSVSDGTKLTGNYDASYDQPTSIANLAGTFTGLAVTGTIAPQTTTVIIDVNGNFTSTYSSGIYSCTTTGKVTPRALGKNV